MAHYTHLSDKELLQRVIMCGEGDGLARELALRMESMVDELETTSTLLEKAQDAAEMAEDHLMQLRADLELEPSTCRECGAEI